MHLLTGIGRFSEMTYVFDILRENHQFELLFRKGMDKVSGVPRAQDKGGGAIRLGYVGAFLTASPNA